MNKVFVLFWPLYLLFETTRALYYILSSTFTGYIRFIVAIWMLSFSCCVIHLVKISKSILARRQITFSALQAHKTLAFTDSVWVKKTLYYSNINYLFTLSLQKSRDLSPPGCARRVNLNGAGWSYKVSLRDDPMALQSFSDKLFLMLIVG